MLIDVNMIMLIKMVINNLFILTILFNVDILCLLFS